MGSTGSKDSNKEMELFSEEEKSCLVENYKQLLGSSDLRDIHQSVVRVRNCYINNDIPRIFVVYFSYDI